MTTTDVKNPVEYVRNLPPEDQEAVLYFLIREVVRLNGSNGQIPFDDKATGEWLGHFVPRDAARHLFDKTMAELPTELREQLTKPLPPDFDPNDTFEFEELFRDDSRAGAA